MNITSKNICIIPARGGSKRIPRKNIKEFLGKPIIAYSIDAAIKSGVFDEIMVSTDDKEIAELAKKFGASVPFFRSNRNADDYATTFDVISEVVTAYETQGQKFDIVCCIYPCAPFVSGEKLKEALEVLNDQQFDTVFPVMSFGFPVQRSLKFENNRISFANPEYAAARSQDLEKDTMMQDSFIC